ncbi:MAG: conjugal transfer protein [Fusobacteriaceae bacterium]|nr:conjugal transfer protein [Fusobacteriaceae bacterium]
MSEKIKVTKLKNKYIKTILTVILWICIGFLIIRGIGTIIRPNPINLKPFKEDVNNKIDKVQKELRGIAFAENFANEYFTFNGDEKEYKERLKKYTELEFTKQTQQIEVAYVNMIKSEWKNGKLLVDLKVGIAKIPDYDNYFKKFLPTPTPKPKTTPKPTPKAKNNELEIRYISFNPEIMFMANSDTGNLERAIDIIYLRVSVQVDEKCKITEYPTFINNPDVSIGDKEKLPGQVLKKESEIKEVEDLVLNFINSYYQGNETEIKYFLKNKENELNLLNGEYVVKEVTTKEMTKKDDKYYAKVVYKVEYKGNVFDNRMEFVLVRDGDKLLVEDNTAIN